MKRLTYRGTKEARSDATIRDILNKLAEYEDREEDMLANENMQENRYGLKPCPFCGNMDAEFGSTMLCFGSDNYVRCPACGAKVQICEEFGKEELIRRWNSRA